MSNSINLALNVGNANADTPELLFTAPAGGVGVIIESFTAANNSTSNKSYKAYISETPAPTTPLRPFQIVIHGDLDLGIGVVNQVIPPGVGLFVESSEANSIFFTVSGREIHDS